MKEDPDAQCTRKQTLMGQGRRRVNNQGVRKPGNHKYGTQTEGKRVVGEDTEIGSKPESQSYNNNRKTKKRENYKNTKTRLPGQGKETRNGL